MGDERVVVSKDDIDRLVEWAERSHAYLYGEGDGYESDGFLAPIFERLRSAPVEGVGQQAEGDDGRADGSGDDGRHAPIAQPGSNVCVCGLLVADDTAHIGRQQ